MTLSTLAGKPRRNDDERPTQESHPVWSGPTQRSHPDAPPDRRHWLTTLLEPVNRVQEAAHAVLDDMAARLEYMRTSGEKIILSAALGERRIRVEISPLDAGSTRIVAVTLHRGEVDRGTSSDFVHAVESHLAVCHA